jgi:type VI secretion system Hcp family effector
VVVCALVAGIVMLPAPARAWQAFAKLTTAAGTIDGDVTLKGFEKQISVLGLGNRLDLPVESSTTGGISVGRLQLGSFQMLKGFDIATPKLVTTMATGAQLTKVEITIFKTTPTGNVPGFKITLTNAFITHMDTTYDPGADPSTIERLEFFYQKLQWTDLITGATGSTP